MENKMRSGEQSDYSDRLHKSLLLHILTNYSGKEAEEERMLREEELSAWKECFIELGETEDSAMHYINKMIEDGEQIELKELADRLGLT
jgi:hypothetical protein